MTIALVLQMLALCSFEQPTEQKGERHLGHLYLLCVDGGCVDGRMRGTENGGTKQFLRRDASSHEDGGGRGIVPKKRRGGGGRTTRRA